MKVMKSADVIIDTILTRDKTMKVKLIFIPSDFEKFRHY